MLGFVQNFFTPKCNPIGIDFGSDCLRMAQVQVVNGEHRLLAAACADVPPHVRHDPNARLNFFMESVRELLGEGKFRGREAILGLPASVMFIQHLRMPKMDAEGMKKALPWELRGKLPIDPSHALLRHVVAGDVYEGQEAKTEVVVMAAAKEFVHTFLAAASKAKLDVIGMNTEPKALVDCFSQIYRRKGDDTAINCFVDIGCVATRAVIAKGTDILFARVIPVGGDHFSRAVAAALNMKFEQAKLLRAQIAAAPSPATEETKEKAPPPPPETEDQNDGQTMENSFALLAAGMKSDRRQDLVETPVKPVDNASATQAQRVELACEEPLKRIIEELELCRRYHETTFPNEPVSRLIFVGGEARQKVLCQHIARQMGLAAQIGDPMVRIARNSDAAFDVIDRKAAHPGWAVASGLSIGPKAGAPVAVEENVSK